MQHVQNIVQADRCIARKKDSSILKYSRCEQKLFYVWDRITLINNLLHTLRWTGRLRLVLNTLLLLLYCMLMLRVVLMCRRLLLLLLPDVLLVGQVLVVILGRGTVLIKRFLIKRGLPVDRQLCHDEIISGTFCVMAHVVIRHYILRLRMLLAGLVPRKERVRGRRKEKEDDEG